MKESGRALWNATPWRATILEPVTVCRRHLWQSSVPSSSGHNGTESRVCCVSPQLSLSQLAATSRHPTISRSGSALPWQQSFPSLLHPSPLASAHQLSHVVRFPPPCTHKQTHTHRYLYFRIYIHCFSILLCTQSLPPKIRGQKSHTLDPVFTTCNSWQQCETMFVSVSSLLRIQ